MCRPDDFPPYPEIENRMTERELIAAHGGLQPAPQEAVTEPAYARDVARAGARGPGPRTYEGDGWPTSDDFEAPIDD